MATNNKYSRTYFIIGLLLGLLLGIFASLKFIQRDIKPEYTPINIILNSDTISNQGIKNSKKNAKKKILKDGNNISITESIEIDSLSSDSIVLDSNDIAFENDSIGKDSISVKIASTKSDSISEVSDYSLKYEVLNIDKHNSDGDIHIAKNELIYAIFAQPEGNKNDFLCNTNYNSKRDSLLINNIKETDADGLYVEFWRSPINYTGYKLSNNTLVLFGIYQYTSISLKYLENGVIELDYLDNKFNLKCTESFIAINLKSNLK